MDDIVKALFALGPGGLIAAVFAYLWREERAERKEAQKALFDMGQRSIEADFTTAKSMDGLSDGLDNLVRTLADERHV